MTPKKPKQRNHKLTQQFLPAKTTSIHEEAEGKETKLTPQSTTLLKMIHPLPLVALAQFLPNKTGHHTAHPLLADDGVAGVVDGDVVFEVDALVGRGHGGFFGLEGGGLGGWHCGLDGW